MVRDGLEVLVAVSPPALETSPTSLHLGHVLSLASTATASFKLANRSLMDQEYGFINIPEVRCENPSKISANLILLKIAKSYDNALAWVPGCLQDVRVEPGGGFGKLRPGEVADLKVVFSPVGAEGRREFVLDVDTVLGLAARSARLHGRRSKSKSRAVARSACSVLVTADVLVPRLQLSAHRVTFPTTSVGAHATTEITMVKILTAPTPLCRASMYYSTPLFHIPRLVPPQKPSSRSRPRTVCRSSLPPARSSKAR